MAKVYKKLYFRFGCLSVFFILSLCISASIFQALEQQPNTGTSLQKENVVKDFSSMHNISAEAMNKFVKELSMPDHNYHQSLTFVEGYVLSFSLFFTIGWGHVTPTRTISKLFTIFVTLIGIPLTFFLIVTGSRILTKHVYELIRILTVPYNQNTNKYTEFKDKKGNKKLFIPIMTVALLVYTLILTFILQRIDGFSFLNGFYYTVITLSTVGFGDLIQESIIKEDSPVKVFGHCVFFTLSILFGLIIIGAIILNFTKRNKKKLKHAAMMNSKVYERCNDENEERENEIENSV